MNEDLSRLRRANPISPDALESVVALDRETLLDMLAADGDDGGRRRPRHRRWGGSDPRLPYGAAVTAAAAALVAVALFGAERSPADEAVTDPAEEQTPVMSVVVDEAGEPQLTAGPDPVVSTTTTTPTTTAVLSETPQPEAEEVTQSPTTVAASPVDPFDPDGPFDRSVDLLSLHFDYAHRDDGHAAVAARELATSFDLTTHVVAGTADSGSAVFVHEFDPLMRSVWGDRWLDASGDRATALDLTVERWLAVIDAGGKVWVAEGGVADFTAEAVREIQRRRPGLATARAIHVVQHNGRNEELSVPANLELVMASTSYQRVDDGNESNGSADLNQPSAALVTAALAGPHDSAWAAAFEYLPASELDFSDTVEVLHILGIGTDQVADPTGFAKLVFG